MRRNRPPPPSAASAPAAGRHARLSTTSRYAAKSTQASKPMAGSATADDSETVGEQKLQKRHQIATACGNCREAKIKCSGQHPQCTRCRMRCLDCAYDVAVEGVTRGEWARQQFARQRLELDRCDAILTFLRSSSDSAAAAVLACLRMGDSLEQVHASLREFAREPSLQRGALPLLPPRLLDPDLRKDSVSRGHWDGVAAGAGSLGRPGARGGEWPGGGSAYVQRGVVDSEVLSSASFADAWPGCWDPALREEPDMQTTGLRDGGVQDAVIMEMDWSSPFRR